MTQEPSNVHACFQRAFRGGLAGDPAISRWRSNEPTWEDVRESWIRPRRNGKPTPWDGLVGKASARTGEQSDLLVRRARPSRRPRSDAGRVWIDDELYYYPLKRGISTPLIVREATGTWRYVGQQVYSNSPRRVGPHWAKDSADPVGQDETDLDSYLGVGRAYRVDALGRRWELQSASSTGLQASLRAYDRRVAEAGMRPEPKDPNGPRRRIEHVPDGVGGEQRFLVPQGGWAVYCDASPTPNIAVNLNTYDDPIAPSAVPLVERRAKVVMVRFTDFEEDTDAFGSGTMVDSQHVLTAGHVTADHNGNPLAQKVPERWPAGLTHGLALDLA